MSISTTRIRSLAIAATASVALIGVSACSSANSDDSAPSSPTSGDQMSQEMTADPAANLVGPGCADYAEAVPQGGGSISGMAEEPVAVAASNNPLLTTLVAAVSGQLNPDVNLVDTLNGGQFTVFAPVDDAFAKVDPATIDTLKTDDALLTKVLTYHVVPGQIAPSEIAGQHPTVEGAAVTVTGSGDALKVNDANVICGGVSTANATVYLIDSVLMPQ
ncbi:immunogenic MPB70 domain protein [Rhodococcus sp. MTM3W5.2]|uniref:fasciclin domain-containing protein n=1 Tax=Rhodococcus sp. MTM3W5.2 TaxID=1805827 RepID=UPI0009797E84|nr:fasciclin domain-containing protein [Rhodococcus sp. MTM3W5.2]AQA25810.1 immunogenic MPB70 domain protein [Rhodococcus sp. MTM3W5.2]